MSNAFDLNNETTDWRTVDRHLRTLARRRAALDAEEARWLREAERLRIWEELGHATMLNYMEHVLGYGPHAASERLRVARALDVLPAMENALTLGAIAYSTARELTRVATVDNEEEWLAAVASKNLRQVEELVAGHAHGDHPTDPKRPELVPHTLRLELSAETMALYRQTRAALEDECGHSLDDNELLAALCRRAMEPPTDKTSGRATHQIAVTLCEECGRGWQDGAGVAFEIDETAIELAHCDAEHIGSLHANPPTRASQTIPPKVKRLVWRRDHGKCSVPGCRSARHLDVHHIRFQEHGGKHDPKNLMVCCDAHHKRIHRGQLTVTGTAPNNLVFERCEAEPRSSVTLSEIADRLPPIKPPVEDVARAALIRMGFRSSEARDRVRSATAHVGNASLEKLLLEALRRSG